MRYLPYQPFVLLLLPLASRSQSLNLSLRKNLSSCIIFILLEDKHLGSDSTYLFGCIVAGLILVAVAVAVSILSLRGN